MGSFGVEKKVEENEMIEGGSDKLRKITRKLN